MVATCKPVREVVAERCGLSLADLTSSSQSSVSLQARRLPFWLCCRLIRLNPEEIAAAFDGRSATTVHTAIERMETQRSDSPETKAAAHRGLQLSLTELAEANDHPSDQPQADGDIPNPLAKNAIPRLSGHVARHLETRSSDR